jgi:hypothetical protein
VPERVPSWRKTTRVLSAAAVRTPLPGAAPIRFDRTRTSSSSSSTAPSRRARLEHGQYSWRVELLRLAPLEAPARPDPR